MRFMAEMAAGRFGPIAEGYKIPFDPDNLKAAALACAERTAEFIAQFDRRRSCGRPACREELGEIVASVARELAHMGVVDWPMTEKEALGLLESAY